MANTYLPTNQAPKALNIIQSSGVLNPKMSLGDLLDLTHSVALQNKLQSNPDANTIRYIIHDQFVLWSES